MSIASGKNYVGSVSSSNQNLVDATTSFAASEKADDMSIATNKCATLGEVYDKFWPAQREALLLVLVKKNIIER